MNFESANPEFHVPHKPYYLRKTTYALEEIRSITNNLQNVPEPFKRLDFQLRLPYKVNMVYGQFDAPANIAVVKKVNGVDGFFLKKVIHETVIDFIWFHEKNCQYLFWGSSNERVIDAMNQIRNRIIACIKEYKLEEDKSEVEPLPCQSRRIVNVKADLAASPPPASEYMSDKEERVLYSPQHNCDRAKRASGPSPQPQQIFRSISVAYYCDSDDE